MKANTLSVNNDTPMSSNPHMAFSGFLVGNLGNSPLGGFFIPDRNIIITRVMASENSSGSGCSTTAQAVILALGGQVLVGVDLGNGQEFADSGPISVSVSAGTKLFVGGFEASGCSIFGGSPSDVMVNAEYVMQ